MVKASTILKTVAKLGATIGALVGVELLVCTSYKTGKIDGEVQTLSDLNALETRRIGLASAYLAKTRSDLENSTQNIKMSVIDECRNGSEDCMGHLAKVLRRKELALIKKAFSKEENHIFVNVLHQSSLELVVDECRKNNAKILELLLDSSDLDVAILYELACKSNVLLEIDECKKYWVCGYPDDVKNFIETFWGSYNLMAMDTGKSGLSVDSFTPDDIV